MKYLLVLISIIGVITYIFVAGPKAVTGQDAVALNRQQEVWDAIGRLEARRQDMLVRAAGRGIGLLPSGAGHDRDWAAGYRMGFARGYSLGTASRGQLQSGFIALGGS
ncbi:MAG: hypothetical protein AB7U59_14200 [Desulfovibrionaceae bacterium]